MSVLCKRLLLAVFFLLSFPVSATETTVEIYVINYPPYTIVQDNKPITGIDVEVITEAFAIRGIKTVFQTAPWKRILKSLEHGRMQATTSCSRNSTREQYMLFSDMVSKVQQVALVKSSARISKLKRFNDLNRYRVMSVSGWSIQRELSEKGIAHIQTPDLDSGIRSLVHRDIDVFYVGELSALHRARELGLGDQVKALHLTDKESTPLFLCMSQKFPGNEKLLEQFNAGLQQIKDNGSYDNIYKRYL